MSQMSFLESVVSWDEQQCRRNVDEALPQLLCCLKETDSLQEEIGIMKIVCQSFLPCLQIHEADSRLFSAISRTSCQTWDKVVDDIKELPKHGTVQQDLHTLLESMVELLDICLLCVKFVQGADNLEMCAVHSLPYGAVHLLKGSYSHCKESVELYGDVLASITEPLSLLFKSAHALQVAFIGMLENVTVGNSSATEQDVQDLSYVCTGLFEVCQIVTSLDLKLMCGIWKTISRLSVRHKALVKETLDVDAMIIYLCGEITPGYRYLFQLAPPLVDTHDTSLSQGDSAAFHKSVKVLGYQMRIMVSLIDAFGDYIADCEPHVVRLLVLLHRQLPSCLSAPEISTSHRDEIRRQLLNASEPLMSLLVGNNRFMECLTMTETEPVEEDCLPLLLVLLQLIDCLPKQKADVVDKWLCPRLYEGDTPRRGLLEVVFHLVPSCYVELSIPLMVPDVASGGKPTRDVSLYEHMCTHLCGLVASFPARHFHLLEETLLTNLVLDNYFLSQLATDVWCFLARFGTADLCYHQVSMLVGLCRHLSCVAVHPCRPLYNLVRRLVNFLAPEHQAQLVQQFPPSENLLVWSVLPLSVFPANTAGGIVADLARQCIQGIQNVVDKPDKTYADLDSVLLPLRCLNNLYGTVDTTRQSLPPPVVTTLTDVVMDLWSMFTGPWTHGAAIDKCCVELMKLSGCLVPSLQSQHVLQIFQCLSACTCDVDVDADIKMAAVQFLHNCSKVKFPPSPQQVQILTRVPQVFRWLLSDTNPIIHHLAVDTFTQFAESTPHETVVSECIGDSPVLQDAVVAFLNKMPHRVQNYTEVGYLSKQKTTLKYSLVTMETVVDAEPVAPPTGAGDILDQIDSTEQPASKRKRRDEDVTEPEDVRQLDTVLQTLESTIQQLESLTCDGAIPSDCVTRLRVCNTKLSQIIQDKG